MSELLFIQIPSEFRSNFEKLPFDPSIPLPVELPDGKISIKPEDISIEMIVSGMLRVLTEGTKSEHLFYYRSFVLSARPNILKEFSGAALLKSKNGDFAMAEEIISALKALFPSSPEVLFLNAVILEDQAWSLERSSKEEAVVNEAFRLTEAAYNEALAVEGTLPSALFNAAFFYKKRQNYAKARDYFSEYVEIADDDLKKEKAISVIHSIEKRGLDDEHFYNAYKLINDGKEDAGMKEIRLFLEVHPTVSNAWFMLGWALRRLGKWEDGSAALHKALELGGTKPDIHNELAICLMESGNLRGAKKELEAALARDADNIKIISNLAILSLKMGNKQEADGFFNTVLELDNNDPLAKKYFSEN
jgi:Flp pilus assembly protein TadD